jgi:hypothetical protein
MRKSGLGVRGMMLCGTVDLVMSEVDSTMKSVCDVAL